MPISMPPMPLVTRPLVNSDELAQWAESVGFDDLVPSAWHVTVARAIPGWPLDTTSLTIGPNISRSVAGMGYFLALLFHSPALARRHAAYRRAGGAWDFRRYRPHVTFAILDGRCLEHVTPYRGRLLFGAETIGW